MKLHKKKISELAKTVGVSVLTDWKLKDYHLVEYNRLKEWAIAKVKNCDITIDVDDLHGEGCCGSIINDWKGNPYTRRCDVCEFLIENVPLTEEDLK